MVFMKRQRRLRSMLGVKRRSARGGPQLQFPASKGRRLSVIEEDRNELFESTIDKFAADGQEQNKQGLERLLSATANPNRLAKDVVARAIVYGGRGEKERSVSKQIRQCIQDFACAEAEHYANNGSSSSFLLDESESDEDEAQFLPSHHLQCLSLQVLAKSLNQILLSSRGAGEEYSQEHREDAINFRDPFWVRVISALSYHIEMPHEGDPEITGYSLRCIRLLHSLEPLVVKRLLQQTLMPYILFLREYGEGRKIALIESEASRLLSGGEMESTRYITI